MKYILLHGLGQSSESWSEVIKELNPEWDILCPDMVEWMVGKEPCYDTLYRELESFCRQFEEPLCLCGLSPVSYTHLDVYKRQDQTLLFIVADVLAGDSGKLFRFFNIFHRDVLLSVWVSG